jgi:lipoate-protein ligase A
MKPAIRCLPFCIASGPVQMAADEVLLESALAGTASLRVYAWEPATVSLGYFQKQAERLRHPRLAAYPWVRRATGGGAIVHDRDLTYAVALPPDWLGGITPACWHDRLHRALAELLGRCGVPASVVCGQRSRPQELDYLCFAVPQPGDVVVQGVKIVGGAQRLRLGALLQHGSIQHPRAGELAQELPAAWAGLLGWLAVPGDWTPAERRRIGELADKYASDAWNLRR